MAPAPVQHNPQTQPVTHVPPPAPAAPAMGGAAAPPPVPGAPAGAPPVPGAPHAGPTWKDHAKDLGMQVGMGVAIPLAANAISGAIAPTPEDPNAPPR